MLVVGVEEEEEEEEEALPKRSISAYPGNRMSRQILCMCVCVRARARARVCARRDKNQDKAET